MIIRFPCSLHVSPALSPLVFTIIFLTFFSPSVSIFACLPLWFWFPPVYQPTIDHITTHSIGFSLIHLALVLTGSTYLEIHGNSKQHRIGKH